MRVGSRSMKPRVYGLLDDMSYRQLICFRCYVLFIYPGDLHVFEHSLKHFVGILHDLI